MKTKNRCLRLLLLMSFICLVPLLESVNAEDVPPTANTVCPVMVGEEVSPSLFVDYKGKRVYFCCSFCVSKFKKNPEKYLENLPAFMEDSSTAAPSAMTPEQALAADTREHLPPFLQFLGKLHPVVVHFPIALILATLLAEVLALISKNWKQSCETSARFMLPLGTVGTLPAVIFGWLAADGAGKTGELALLLYRHRWLGVVTLAVSVIATLLQIYSKRDHNPAINWMYRLALLLTALLVGATGHLGGLLVYGIDRF